MRLKVFVGRCGPARFGRVASGRCPGSASDDERKCQSRLGHSAGTHRECLCAILNGPSDADTYTGGFLYWLGYSGFDFGVVVAGIVLLVMWRSPDRASIAATSLLSVTMLAALLAMFGVIGK